MAREVSIRPPLLPFCVRDNGLGGPDVPTLAAKVALAAELRFRGIDFQLDHEELPRQIEQLEKHHLDVAAVHTTVFLEQDSDERLAAAIRWLKGRKTRIQIAFGSRRLAASDAAGDKRACEILRQLSDLCANTGPHISISPEGDFWIRSQDDALRLAEAVDRRNVGINFNYWQWTRCRPQRPLAELLRDARARLCFAQLCGIAGGKPAPLDQGQAGIEELLGQFKTIDYTGPVALDCQGIEGDSRQHLAASMRVWLGLIQRTD